MDSREQGAVEEGIDYCKINIKMLSVCKVMLSIALIIVILPVLNVLYQKMNGIDDDISYVNTFIRWIGLVLILLLLSNWQQRDYRKRFLELFDCRFAFIENLKLWTDVIKKRDGYKCAFCGRSRRIAAHHIAPKKKYKQQFKSLTYCLYNGITVCPECHLIAAEIFERLYQVCNIFPKEFEK